jgi:chemotaxis protein CheX
MLVSDENVFRIAESTWSMILGLELARGKEPATGGPTVSATVAISGAWEGRATLTCPLALADRAAARMFGIAPGTAKPDQVSDALGELANIVGGNVKALLPEPCKLSLPRVETGSGYARSANEVVRVAMNCGSEPVVVAIASA